MTLKRNLFINKSVYIVQELHDRLLGRQIPKYILFNHFVQHKNRNMEKYTIQQEILLVIASILSKKQWCESIALKQIRRPLPLVDQLKYACSKNFLEEVLPEIIDKSMFTGRFHIWPIQRNNNLLQISICKAPLTFDKQHSINTECFLQTLNYN